MLSEIARRGQSCPRSRPIRASAWRASTSDVPLGTSREKAGKRLGEGGTPTSPPTGTRINEAAFQADRIGSAERPPANRSRRREATAPVFGYAQRNLRERA